LLYLLYETNNNSTTTGTKEMKADYKNFPGISQAWSNAETHHKMKIL